MAGGKHLGNHRAQQPLLTLSGVDSGFMINANLANPGPTFDVPVTSTEAVWMYCKQANHCADGMVFAINPPAPAAPNNMEAFKAKAVLAGPPKKLAALQMVNAQQAAVASTVSIAVGGANAAATAAGGAPMATVAAGQGTAPNGQTCNCQCLCGQNSFPQGVGQGEFGGFLGE